MPYRVTLRLRVLPDAIAYTRRPVLPKQIIVKRCLQNFAEKLKKFLIFNADEQFLDTLSPTTFSGNAIKLYGV
jgi:hypothetical protein